jgi:hypothetical protein
MYIFIFEDGQIQKSASILGEELDECDDGTLSVLDISNPTDPKQYYKGKWEEVKFIERGLDE